MTKKKKLVQDAAEQTPSKPETAPQEAPSAPMVPEAAAPIQIPQKVLDQAKALGIDLQQIVDWAKSMEQFKAVTLANFQIIQDSFNELKPLIQLSQRIQQRQSQPQSGVAPGSDLLGIVQQIVPLFGGGSNPVTDELTKKIIDAGIEQMTMGTTLLKAVEKKILADMGAKVATEVVPK